MTMSCTQWCSGWREWRMRSRSCLIEGGLISVAWRLVWRRDCWGSKGRRGRKGKKRNMRNIKIRSPRFIRSWKLRGTSMSSLIPRLTRICWNSQWRKKSGPMRRNLSVCCRSLMPSDRLIDQWENRCMNEGNGDIYNFLVVVVLLQQPVNVSR